MKLKKIIVSMTMVSLGLSGAISAFAINNSDEKLTVSNPTALQADKLKAKVGETPAPTPTPKKTFGDYVAGKYTDSLWGATGGAVFNSINGRIVNSLVGSSWNNLMNLIFGGPGPDKYMVALQQIQGSLDRIEGKVDDIMGIDLVTYNEILQFHSEYTDDQIKSDISSIDELPNAILYKQDIISESMTEAQSEYSFQTEDGDIDADKLFDFAMDDANKNLIPVLDGSDSRLAKGIQEEQPITSLIENYKHIDTGSSLESFNSINNHLAIKLNTSSGNNHIDVPGIQNGGNRGDLVAPWLSANKTIQDLTSNYYVSLYSLYKIQLLQLAYYYAHPNLFTSTAVNPEFTKDIDIDYKELSGDEYKKAANEAFLLAYEKVDGEFRGGFMTKTQSIFGNGDDLGVIYNKIPTLPKYLDRITDSTLFSDNDLLNKCTISSLVMPANANSDDQWLTGRLEMECYPDFDPDNPEKVVSSVVRVGHDIPYKTYTENSNHYITASGGNSNISKLSFDADNLKLSAEINDSKSFYQWMPDTDMDDGGNFAFDYSDFSKDVLKQITGNYFAVAENTTVANLWTSHSWAQYMGYGYYIPKGISRVSNDTHNFKSNKNDNPYGRNSIADYYADEKIGSNYFGRLTYCPNQSNTWYGEAKTKTTHPWMQSQTMLVGKNGHLFAIDNQFPKVQLHGGDESIRYAQFTRPVCLSSTGVGAVCSTKDLNYTDRTGPSSSYVIGKDAKNPKSVIKYTDGTEIGVYGKQVSARNYADDTDVDHDDQHIYESGKLIYHASKEATYFDILFKTPNVYQFNVDNDEYKAWLDNDNKSQLSYAYLDGSLAFKKAENNQVILTQKGSDNKEYRLIYTVSGSLQIIKIIDGDEDDYTVVKSFKYKSNTDGAEQDITSTYLTLRNGDLVFSRNDGKVLAYSENAYNNHNKQWVSDPYAKLILSNTGELSIISEATDIEDNKVKIGSEGTIISTAWDNENWPDFTTISNWSKAPEYQKLHWTGKSKDSGTKFDEGILKGCATEWY